MKRVVSLLNQKNHYLEKFYATNEKEIQNFLEGKFDSVEAFYQTREKILEMIKYIDSELEKAQHIAKDSETTQLKTMIRESLAIKDLYVEKIIEQDIQILACIEGAKNNIIKELQQLRKNRRGIVGYKAPSIGK